MKNREKAILIWVVLGVLTLGIYVLASLDVGWQRLLPAVFAGISWNLYAYGFDKGIWPRRFVELDGHAKGQPLAREIVLWATVFIYFMLLVLLMASY